MNDRPRITFRDLPQGIYMMGTLATHRYGDVSINCPKLCYIYGEQDYNWVGRWVFDWPNHFDILFYKQTTRSLTDEEIVIHKHVWEGKFGDKMRERQRILYSISRPEKYPKNCDYFSP